jgi:rod shape-determining protein MreC
MLPEASYDTALNRTAVNDTNFNQQYSYIVSKVINNSVNRRNNYLTLNKGSLSGVKPEMGVITTNGIVGIIKDVSPHYSTVMSLLHSRSSVSARFKNNNYFGAMIWEDNNDPTTATLSDIPKHIQFKIGDTLVTTAYSTVYPENIFLGTVKSSTIKAGANFYTITIKLSTDFYSLTHVYIVDNLFKKEQQLLEEKFKREQQKLESKSTK